MVLILNEQSAWLYPSILKDSLKMDYPFQIAYVQPPPQVSRFVQQEGKSARTIGEAAGGYVRRSFVSLTNKTPSCAGRTEW